MMTPILLSKDLPAWPSPGSEGESRDSECVITLCSVYQFLLAMMEGAAIKVKWPMMLVTS